MPAEDAITGAGTEHLGTLPLGTSPAGTLADSAGPSGGRHDGRAPTISGFEMLGELGRGGVGVVYKARQIALNRLVAIKTLSSHMQSQPEVLAQFRTEAHSVARLQHPNIVQVFEIGESSGQPFLALEFVPGGTLAQYLGRQPQPIRFAVELTHTLAVAIDHAHKQGILHRDLKPGNVLLNKGESAEANPGAASDRDTLPIVGKAVSITPKITDFGLAKQIHASDGPTEMGAVIGTPSYMAPEQASGVTRTFTAAVDVYALGAILYEMLTGRPPFLGESPTQTVLQVLSQEPVPPRELRPDCPRDLETIALKCLQKNPTRRYATARDLAEDLRRFAAGEPITARPAGIVERTLKWAKRRPTAAAALIAGVVLLVVSILYGLEQRRHGIELQNLAEQERKALKRSEANFQIARSAIKDLLADVGAKDLESVPQMDQVRRSLMKKATDAMQELLCQNRGNASTTREVGQIEFDSGELYELLGDSDQALLHFSEAAQIYQKLCSSPNPEPGIIRERVTVMKSLATLIMDRGDPDEAAKIFQEGLTIADDLNTKWPNDPDNILARCRLLLNRGQLLSHLNQAAEGVKDFERARDDLLAITKKHAERNDLRESLAGAFNNIGVNARAAGHQDIAAQSYKEALKIYRELIELSPDNRKYRFYSTIAARNLGTANWWLEKSDDAITAFQTAITDSRKLLKDYPGIPTYQVNLALALSALGELLAYENKPDAFALLREAVSILEKVVADQPKNAENQYQLGFAMTRMAFAFMNGHNWVDALHWEELSIKKFRAAVALNSKDVRYRGLLQDQLKRHARSFLESNKLDEIPTTLDELIEVSKGSGGEAFEAACLLAQCAAKSKGEAAEKFAARAVEMIRKAIAGKALDETKLRSTPELDPLRSRRDFQELAKQLSGPK